MDRTPITEMTMDLLDKIEEDYIEDDDATIIRCLLVVEFQVTHPDDEDKWRREIVWAKRPGADAATEAYLGGVVYTAALKGHVG